MKNVEISGLRTRIQECTNCILHKNMEISPIASEIFGPNPKIMVVVSNRVSRLNDIEQNVLGPADRAALIKLFEKYKLDFKLTYLVKCISNKYYISPKHIKECSKWIELERPKITIGFGSNISKYIKLDYCFENINKVISSKELLQELEKVLYDCAQ